MPLACAEGLHVEEEERIVPEDVQPLPRLERRETFPRANDRDRTPQPAGLHRRDGTLRHTEAPRCDPPRRIKAPRGSGHELRSSQRTRSSSHEPEEELGHP